MGLCSILATSSAEAHFLNQGNVLSLRVAGGAAPDVPTGFTATAGNQQTTLTWDAQAEADTFTIRYGLTDNFGTSTELTAAATGTSFVHDAGESIVAGERYYYWIQAVNGDGESSFSTSVVARSFVSVANGANINLTTPTGTWTVSTLFFRSGGVLPYNCTVTWGGLPDIAIAIGGGVWEDGINGGNYDPSISGAFNFDNQTGGSVTIWDAEP